MDIPVIAAGGIAEAIKRARAYSGHMVKLECEVDSLDQLREALALCERQRDLLLLGAYQRGSDPATDAALQLLPQIEAFLRQDRSDRSDFAVTRRRLLGLFAGGADPG